MAILSDAALNSGNGAGVLPDWLLQALQGAQAQAAPQQAAGYNPIASDFSQFPNAQQPPQTLMDFYKQQAQAQAQPPPLPPPSTVASAPQPPPPQAAMAQAPPTPPAPQGVPQNALAGFGDRLSAGLMGFANSGGPLPALANLISGLATGKRSDPVGYQQQVMQQTYQAIKAAGGTDAQAQAGAVSPEVFKAIAPELFGGWKLVKTGSNPITGDQMMMQGPGGQLRSLEDFTKGGQRSAGTGSIGSGMLAQGVKQYDPTLTGEDYLKQFSPEMQAAVKSYLNGDVMPSGNPRLQGIAQAAKTVAQTYAQGVGQPQLASDITYGAKRKMQVDLASSAPNSMGGILSNGKSAFAHLANLGDKFVDLGNISGPDIPGGGHIGTVGNVVGNILLPTPQTKGKLTAVNDNALKYGQEATKFYAGTGGGEAERMNALREVNGGSKTGQEQAAFLETEKQLMLERLSQKEAQVRSTMGDQYLQDHPVRTPDLEKSIQKIDANIARLRGQSAPAGAAPAPATTPSSTQPLKPGKYNWTPQGGFTQQ